MITVKHYHDGDYHLSVTETDQGRTYLRNKYAMGWDEPHYPLPVSMMTAILSCIHQDAAKVWSIELAKQQLRRSLDNTFVSTRR